METNHDDCPCCGSNIKDRIKYRDKALDPTNINLFECDFCGGLKCCMCDMGHDVSCMNCEGDDES